MQAGNFIMTVTARIVVITGASSGFSEGPCAPLPIGAAFEARCATPWGATRARRQRRRQECRRADPRPAVNKYYEISISGTPTALQIVAAHAVLLTFRILVR